jgi:hypothetical protein
MPAIHSGKSPVQNSKIKHGSGEDARQGLKVKSKMRKGTKPVIDFPSYQIKLRSKDYLGYSLAYKAQPGELSHGD